MTVFTQPQHPRKPVDVGTLDGIEERETTVLYDPKTLDYPGYKTQYDNPQHTHMVGKVDQTRNNIDRGGYSHGVEQLELPGLHKDQLDPHSRDNSFAPNTELRHKYRTVTHTWQVPIPQGAPVRILPQDPDRVRAVLYVDVADLTVFVTPLYSGPQSDYGFPILPGGEYFWVYGQNQLWGALPSNAVAPSRMFVLIERRLIDE